MADPSLEESPLGPGRLGAQVLLTRWGRGGRLEMKDAWCPQHITDHRRGSGPVSCSDPSPDSISPQGGRFMADLLKLRCSMQCAPFLLLMANNRNVLCCEIQSVQGGREGHAGHPGLAVGSVVGGHSSVPGLCGSGRRRGPEHQCAMSDPERPWRCSDGACALAAGAEL